MAESILLKHWIESEDGKTITTLTDDDYWFCLQSIGDGWVWSVYTIKIDPAKSVSPPNRLVRKTPLECIDDAREWYKQLVIRRIIAVK